MVRKRRADERWRDRFRKRPKTPAPKTGWVAREVTALTGIKARTISHYIANGIIDAPEFRGTITRYQRPQLLRLLAVRWLKAEGLSTLSTIRERLNAMGHVELERYLQGRQLPQDVMRVLGWADSNVPQPATGSNGGAMDLSGEAWRRVTLLPGLELLLKDDASPVVRELAQRVCAQFRSP